MVTRICLLTSLCIAFVSPVIAAAQDEQKPTAPVQIDIGSVRGLVIGEDDGLHVFKGVPFAAPPIGDLRWRPPVRTKKHAGILDCFTFGGAAIQEPLGSLGVMPGFELGAEQSEDCLYLNIWTPADAKGKSLPVMVWIHGGAYVIGSGSQSMYDGEALAEQGVILVTINYRLGAFGFLAHPELSRESEFGSSGNYGLLDQIEALKWVQRNISGFGGDPERVTIFGESAGGGSVFTLLVSPLADGLFHRAIAESGPILVHKHLDESYAGMNSMETVGQEFFAKHGADDSPKGLAAMRAMPAKELQKAVPSMLESGTRPMLGDMMELAPIVDGWVIPDNPIDILNSGKQSDVPVIIGANQDEGTLFTMLAGGMVSTEDAFRKYVQTNFGVYADRILAQYVSDDNLHPKDRQNYLMRDWMFLAAARTFARGWENVQSEAFYYHFTRTPATPMAKMLGAHHAAEVSYVFNNLVGVKSPPVRDSELAKQMSRYWVQFAATGNPNGGGLPLWPEYKKASDKHLEFGNTTQVGQGLESDNIDLLDDIISDWTGGL
jgi:para-nitrobenzyl esterase